VKRLFSLLICIIGLLVNLLPAQAAGVVGTGTAASCTEATLNTALSGGGSVTFNCGAAPVTIQITSTKNIASATTIDGGGRITLDGRGTTRIFTTQANLTLRNMTLTRGYGSGANEAANGGAVRSGYLHNLTVENVTFRANTVNLTSFSGSGINAYDFGGAAIYTNGGTLTVTNSVFIDNTATNSAGGAIHGLRTDMIITGSTFTNNTSTGGGQGGAIYIDGAQNNSNGIINISDSVFGGNNAANQGGAIYVHLYQANDSFTVDNSVFQDNTVSGGTNGLGGAISGGNGRMTITNSLFSGNSVSRAGTPGDGSGGAVASAETAVITIANSTFVGNRALGTSYNANGGALYFVNHTQAYTITNSTIANNYAGWVGGGITGSNGVLRNTIVAHNSAYNGGNGWQILQQCSDTLTNGGGVIQYPPRNPNPNYWNETICAAGQIVQDPLLGSLSHNGGFSRTLPLLAGSPAIGAGVVANCQNAPVSNVDQRGQTRTGGADTTCDIGAFESPFVPAPNLIQNGDFNSGTANWTTYDAIQSRVSSGVFEFYRLSGGVSAVVYQNTGAAVPNGAPLDIRLNLGNSSAVRKRVVILAHEANFSDLQMCAFWLPPNTPLRQYRMQTRTLRAWTNASLSIYGSPADSVGWMRVDNVSMRHDPTLTMRGDTWCFDPAGPAPTNTADGANLISNGGFASVLSPWTPYGMVTADINSGLLRFYRRPGTPSGVVLQNTGANLPANARLEARFQLGNNSDVRKRVTVLLHAANFSDMQACTFWLEPRAPLATYVIRTHTTTAWTGAVFAAYPNPADSIGWIVMDNVSMRQRPNLRIVGTECYPPGSGISMEDVAVDEAVDLNSMIPTLAPTATATIPMQADAEGAPLFTPTPPAIEPNSEGQAGE
jgi:hypothetical protein